MSVNPLGSGPRICGGKLAPEWALSYLDTIEITRHFENGSQALKNQACEGFFVVDCHILYD